jgi:mannose-1-phosphate guanylyltransferase
MNLYGIILAGGGGTRLWPLSRTHRPKPLLPLFGGATLLQETVARLAPVIPGERLFIVANAGHVPEVTSQVPQIPPAQVIGEPVARDTAAALGLAAIHLAHRDPDATLASFHADHMIARPDALIAAVRCAAEAACDGAIVTIGITPTHPATGYGYIELDAARDATGGLRLHAARRFVEKPEQQIAAEYLAAGNFVWNAGLFICRVATLLDAFAAHLPALHEGLTRIAATIGTEAYPEILAAVFPQLPKVSFDVGVMERHQPVLTVPCEPGWSDVGDWDTLARMLDGDADGNIAVGAPHLAFETTGTLIHGRGRLIATVGLDDVVIVDTEDAVLVLPRSRAQDVKRLVEQLGDQSGEADRDRPSP